PTFYRIYKKKIIEGFQAIPYITALFTIFVKDATFLLTINTFGIVIKSIYLAILLIYSPKKARLCTIKIILLLNVFGIGAIVLSTLYLTKGDKRVTVIGWFNLILNICVFTSPLDSLRYGCFGYVWGKLLTGSMFLENSQIEENDAKE
ncbi:hypothetical protein S83_012975, partial [Arachis hypogaea]